MTWVNIWFVDYLSQVVRIKKRFCSENLNSACKLKIPMFCFVQHQLQNFYVKFASTELSTGCSCRSDRFHAVRFLWDPNTKTPDLFPCFPSKTWNNKASPVLRWIVSSRSTATFGPALVNTFSMRTLRGGSRCLPPVRRGAAVRFFFQSFQ